MTLPHWTFPWLELKRKLRLFILITVTFDLTKPGTNPYLFLQPLNRISIEVSGLSVVSDFFALWNSSWCLGNRLKWKKFKCFFAFFFFFFFWRLLTFGIHFKLWLKHLSHRKQEHTSIFILHKIPSKGLCIVINDAHE